MEPLARSRELQSQNKWADAVACIRDALSNDANSADLNAELAYLLCMEAKEDEAMQFANAGANGEKGPDALRMLARHYHARKLAAKKIDKPDKRAQECLKTVKELLLQTNRKLGPLGGISVTACLIVKNEERHLYECLQTLQGYCDEIVVVDTGSSDHTIPIAESFGAKIGLFDWNDDFAEARNHALSLATGDWILWIDADERVASGGHGALLSAVIRPQYGGYTIPIVNYLNEDESQDQVQHRPCRLFQRLPGVHFEGRIHEQIAPSIVRMGLPIARLEGMTLLHYGYRAGEMSEKGKHERTIGMLRRELEDNPQDGFHLFNLGNALFTAGDYEEAADYCKLACERLEPGVYHAQFCYQLWAFAHYYCGEYDLSLDACDAADKAGYGGQLIEYTRAFTLRALDKLDEALEACDRCLSLSLGEEETGDRSIAQYKGDFLKGQLLASLQRTEEAISLYLKVIERVPNFTPAHLALALEYKRIGRVEESLAQCEPAIDASENGLIAADLAELCAKELGRPYECCRIREKVWLAEETNEALCLRWLKSAEDAGDWHTAARAYAQYLQRFEPTAPILINAGRAFRSVNANQAALDCLTKAVELAPCDPNAYFNAADLLYKCEKFADACLTYRSGLAIDPENAAAWFTFGNALFRSNILDGAAIAYEQTLRLEPSHEGAAHNLAIVRENVQEMAS